MCQSNAQISPMAIQQITWYKIRAVHCRLLVVALFIVSSLQASAQPLINKPFTNAVVTDTLRLTLAQADEQFKAHNLNLLAAQLGITENKAYEIQSQLRINPTVYVETMPYNQQRREVLPFRQTNSEQLVQVQQLIRLAGKRNKQLAVAKTTTDIATDRLYDLLRTLTYQLHTSFYELYYGQQSLDVYDQEMLTLQQTVALYQQQYDKGNVALRDLTRLKAYLFNLTTERQQLLRRLTDDQADLAVLLNANPATFIQPVLTSDALNQFTIDQLNINNLYQLAEQHRFDLKGYRDLAKQEHQNLTLQKALAVPDMTIQGTYDRNAG